MKIFQIVDGICKWLTPFTSMSQIYERYPSSLLFVEAPDWVGEGYIYDTEKSGDERFVMPEAPEGFIYDDETGELVEEEKFPELLLTTQLRIQKENTDALAAYLSNRSVTFTDGKEYGVTFEDQAEINMNIAQYDALVALGVEDPPLEWHSIREGCVPWTKENLVQLVAMISAEVYPAFKLMNAFKEKIFKLEDRQAIRDMRIEYTEELTKWIADGHTIDDYTYSETEDTSEEDQIDE